MILGIGTDIIKISRIEKMLEEHKESFLAHIFSAKEQAEATNRKDSAQYYAGRWVAKEALSKALGCGIGELCAWKDITVLNNLHGKPEIVLSGSGADSAARMGAKMIHVSISHEKNYASAVVVLEG